ncbi:MAG: hypothetical protein WBQ17_01330 [Rhizomicrobium sp.]
MDLIALIFAWSIAAMVIFQFVLWYFLRSNGVAVDFFYVGMPGYLDRKYVAWCKQHNRSYWFAIALRIVFPLSAILSSVVLFHK